MKRALIGISLATLLISSIIGLAGCGYVAQEDAFIARAFLDVSMMGPADNPAMEQMGETKAEVYRRYRRNLRLNRQAMMEDMDAFWHLDKPSRMTERTIP